MARDDVAAHAVVDDRVVVTHDIIIHHGAVLVDIHRAVRRHNMIDDAAVAEAPCGHEGVVIVAIAEAEIKSDIPAPVAEADPRPHSSAWR
jgi:hypothetical protein